MSTPPWLIPWSWVSPGLLVRGAVGVCHTGRRAGVARLRWGSERGPDSGREQRVSTPHATGLKLSQFLSRLRTSGSLRTESLSVEKLRHREAVSPSRRRRFGLWCRDVSVPPVGEVPLHSLANCSRPHPALVSSAGHTVGPQISDRSEHANLASPNSPAIANGLPGAESETRRSRHTGPGFRGQDPADLRPLFDSLFLVLSAGVWVGT